jgi:hypothetical protein
MSSRDLTSADESLEECIDELGDLLASLERHPPTVVALALRVHLAGLLRVLFENDLRTHGEILDFLQRLQQDVLRDCSD